MTEIPNHRREQSQDKLAASQPAEPRLVEARSERTGRPADSVPTNAGPFAVLPIQFGRYLIQRELGHGQMGAVYLALDEELDRLVALKVARTTESTAAILMKRMVIEAKSAAKVDHPLICKVYDAGEIDGIRFIALQYVEGEDLKKYLKRMGRKRPPSEAIGFILQILRALEAAHESGVIHRDLKPANVMLNKKREPIIMDFGLARRTITTSDAGVTRGMIVGTAAYMSPEQATGKPEAIDHRSDLYAVGVMLFEMLTGEWPFTGGAVEVMGKKCILDPPSPLSVCQELNSQLSTVCQKMIAKNKVDRFVTCAEAIDALASLDLNAISAPKPSPASLVAGVPISAIDLNSEGRPASIQSDEQEPNFDFLQGLSASSSIRKSQSILVKKKSGTLITRALRWAILAGTVACMLALAMTFMRSTHEGPSKNAMNDQKVSGKNPFPTQSSTSSSPIEIQEFGGKTAGEARKFALDLTFRWCPATTKSFVMGTVGADWDEASVSVTLSRGFWLSETELTQGQWTEVMLSRPWHGNANVKEGERYAATYLSDNDAMDFCNKLTNQERSAGRLPRDWKYTLPTEAQWEYACRAGSRSAYSFGDDENRLGDYGWYDQNAVNIGQHYPHEVGLKRPNEWGFKDMHGNVWEWCADWYQPNLQGGLDPSGPSSGEFRVIRGGAWASTASHARSAARGRWLTNSRPEGMGLRVGIVTSEGNVD